MVSKQYPDQGSGNVGTGKNAQGVSGGQTQQQNKSHVSQDQQKPGEGSWQAQSGANQREKNKQQMNASDDAKRSGGPAQGSQRGINQDEE